MAKQKVAKLGIEREDGWMYFISKGAVWRVPRRGEKGRRQKVVDLGIEQDNGYLYFLDKNGDVSRAARAVRGKAKRANPRKAARKSKKR